MKNITFWGIVLVSMWIFISSLLTTQLLFAHSQFQLPISPSQTLSVLQEVTQSTPQPSQSTQSKVDYFLPLISQPSQDKKLINASASVIENLNSDNNYFLKIDLQDPRVQVRVGLANNDNGGYQTLQNQVDRYLGKGYMDWVAINADYFSLSGCPSNTNCAQGLTYIDGTRKGNWTSYGNTWQVRGNLGFDNAKGLEGAVGDAQSKRSMVIAGGPWVVKGGSTPTCNGIVSGGKTFFPETGEWFDGDVRWWCTTTGTVAAVGYSADRRYLFMGISYGGKTIIQLAQWLKERGASDVMKLDGGGSTSMYRNGTAIYASSRAIANHLAVVILNNPTATPITPAPTPTAVQSPAPPTLANPANGAVLSTDNDITLAWNSAANATEYAAELRGPVTKFSGRVNGTSYFVGRLPAGEYTWNVEAYNSAGWSGWVYRSFTVTAPQSTPTPVTPAPTPTAAQSPAPPVLSSPANGAVLSTDSDITLVWNSVAGATEYAAELWGPVTKFSGRVNGTSYFVGRLPAGEYTWNVEAYNSTGWSGWVYRSFTVTAPQSTPTPVTPAPTPTAAQSPAPPVLSSPANGAVLSTDSDITLVWNSVAGATEYAAELWGPVTKFSGRVNGTSYFVGRLPAGEYTWNVEAYNSTGWSGWVYRSFTVTAPQPPDPIFTDDFESGSLSRWILCPNSSGLSVTSAAALRGTKGVQATIGSNTAICLTEETPSAESRYRVRFYFDPNTIKMKSSDAHYLFYGYTGASTAVLRIDFRFSSGKYQLSAGLLNDSTTWKSSSWVTISDAPHFIELDWKASTSASAKNGYLTLWIDGVQKANLTKIDNDTRRIDRIQLGAVALIDTGTRGSYYFDDFVSHRQNYIGPASSAQSAAIAEPEFAAESVSEAVSYPAITVSTTMQPGLASRLTSELSGLQIEAALPVNTSSEALTGLLVSTDTQTMPDGYRLLGEMFTLQLQHADGTFTNELAQPATLTINYATLVDVAMPAGEVSLQAWNGEAEVWEMVPATVNTADHTITALITQPVTLAVWQTDQSAVNMLYLPTIQQ